MVEPAVRVIGPVADRPRVGDTAQHSRLVVGSSVRLAAAPVPPPVVAENSRQLNALQLGTDVGTALGVRTTRLQLVAAGLGALLAAVVVSVAGPIGFVAFISPHIARRLCRTTSSAALPVGMAVGALLMLLADHAAERVLEPTDLPVGIATTVIGAPYLLVLLVRGERGAGLR